MQAGKLDRRIRIDRWDETGRNELNEPMPAWTTVTTVWAQQRPNRGDERFSSGQLAGQIVMTFHIRFRGDLTREDRIVYEGRAYNIKDIREVGRRKVSEIDCVATAEG
ncbi:phage head closure protein [Martelella soudanensis]|uniref:phage head closure protein n=1 Tax=unclassified Martelella TaxID=2629616 RepID=UPI0015E02495|nr:MULTISPECIES: phage head closure protein [unclassified Martelella]